MKTTKKLLEEKETFDKNYPVISINDALEAMKEYAEQFIDEAYDMLECYSTPEYNVKSKEERSKACLDSYEDIAYLGTFDKDKLKEQLV